MDKAKEELERQAAIIKYLAVMELQRREALLNYSAFSNAYIKITDKKGNSVPLKQNYVQRQIGAKIEELRQQGTPPRIIALKSRQMGVSTDTQGRMIYETTTKPNKNGFIVDIWKRRGRFACN
jgi:hypothetical protein